ncbi:hypothetical protein JX266_005055 [Neoarthrinium moseri]|nr:hypothetical protein JX266_005055 [Neoarthrinium moseri]
MPGQFAQKILNKLGVGEQHQGPGPSSGGSGAAAYPCHIAEDARQLHPSGGTYPRLCRLSDGSILCGSTRFEGAERVLHVSRSTDNAQTFAPWGEVARGAGDCDNLFLCEVSPGPTVLSAFRNHDLDPGSRKPTHFRITVCHSGDGGRTWHFLSQAAEQSAAQTGGMGLWEPFIRLGRQGDVQLTYSAELAGDNQETFRVVSRDGGATWSPPQCLRCHGPEERLRDGMQGIVSVRDGASGQDAVEYAVSWDDGASWGSRGVVYCPPWGRNAGAPQIANFGNGGLAVVFMTDEDAMAADWPKNAAVKAAVAGGLHGGRIAWSKPMLISGASSFWPGILDVGNNEVMAVFEHGGRPLGKLLRWR